MSGGPPADPADEMVAVVDEQNQVIGAVPRREMRAGRLFHRATYILAFNSRRELYVQKRTMTKDVYPGYYDPAAGGVVLAGESYEQSAERELGEELGIRGVALAEEFDLYFEDAGSRVFGRVFSCQYDGELVLQKEEVESVRTMTVAQVLEAAAREKFAPDSLTVVRRYASKVSA